jgi:hypothetical protein
MLCNVHLTYADVIDDVTFYGRNKSARCLLAKYHMNVKLCNERIFPFVEAKLKLNKSHFGGSYPGLAGT